MIRRSKLYEALEEKPLVFGMPFPYFFPCLVSVPIFSFVKKPHAPFELLPILDTHREFRQRVAADLFWFLLLWPCILHVDRNYQKGSPFASRCDKKNVLNVVAASMVFPERCIEIPLPCLQRNFPVSGYSRLALRTMAILKTIPQHAKSPSLDKRFVACRAIRMLIPSDMTRQIAGIHVP